MLHPPLSAGAWRIAALLLTISLLPAVVHGACAARSGPGTTALVELYTALACDACAQADRWIADVSRRYAARSAVPLVFHVRDGDYTNGGRSADDVWRRERRLLPRQRLALAYAPRVLLQGVDFPKWRDARFDRALEQVVALPSRAHLALAILGASDATLRVRVEAVAPKTTAANVYVATFEERVAGGRAFQWIGPFGLGRQELELALVPQAPAAGSGVAGFVQDARTGAVLQALMLSPCQP